MNTHYISSKRLDINTIKSIVFGDYKIALSEEAITNIETCRNYLDKKWKPTRGQSMV